MFIAISVIICLIGAALGYILNLLSKRARDVWDFYGFLEKKWIKNQNRRIEKYIKHVE